MHLAVNLVAFLSFGPMVQQVLHSKALELSSFVLGSALSGSICSLILNYIVYRNTTQRGGGGCLGLSGVTFSLFAFKAKMFPDSIIGIIVGFIPVRLPAGILLISALVVSVFGALFATSSTIAHSAHLGGILFGIAYHHAYFGSTAAKRNKWKMTSTTKKGSITKLF